MKDWCTMFPEYWYTYSGDKVYIGDLCKAHDDEDDVRGGCASHTFIEGLMERKIVGGVIIFTIASLACWVRYPKEMWSRL